MGAAIGSRGSRGGPKYADPVALDLRDFGASLSDATATTAALQAAIDAMADLPAGKSRAIYVPPGTWPLDGPILCDQDKLSLFSDPRHRGLLNWQYGYTGTGIFLGIPRTATAQGVSQSLDASYFIDLHGKLDATAASAAGQRWGVRTHGDSVIAQGAGEFSFGVAVGGYFGPPDYYGRARVLTIDLALDTDATPLADQPIAGMAAHGNPAPWFVMTEGGGTKVAALFRTAEGTVRSFSFAAPTTPGVHRLSAMIDLDAASVAAWVDRTRVATDDSGLGAGFAPGSLAFAENLNVPFKINGLTWNANAFGTDYWSFTSYDLALYGCRAVAGPVYLADAVGQAQRRADGQPITDANSFFQAETGLIGYFPFQDLPSDVINRRFLTIQGTVGRSVAMFLSANHAKPETSKGAYRIHDIDLKLPYWPYGEAFSCGFLLDSTFEDCQIEGGAHAIGTWNWGANYVNRIKRCWLLGCDAALYNFYGMWEVEDLFIMLNGRSAIWCNQGSLRATRLFHSYQGQPEYIARVTEGGTLIARDWSVDIEDGARAYPSKGAFYAESSSSGGNTYGGMLQLDDIQFGTIGRGTPFVELHTSGPNDPPSVFRLDGLNLFGDDYAALVRTDGPAWHGEISTTIDPAVAPPVVFTGGGSGIVSRHTTLAGPPRHGTWTRNAHRLEVADPADGHYALWRCIGTGRYGTATPPAWQGHQPSDTGPADLAAFVTDHAYWTAGPGTRWGAYTDRTAADTLNALLGVAAATPPATLYLGLSTLPASRSSPRPGAFAEPATAAGYARVPITFAASADGSAAAATTAAFPTATADWTGVRSLFLAGTSTGDTALAVIDLDPFDVPTGTAPSYAAGSIAVAASGTRLAPAWSDAINDLWLRAGPSPAPAVHLALSTDPADPSRTPAEPTGGGYARVAPSASAWAAADGDPYHAWYRLGFTANAEPLAFPAPSGDWGTARSVYLMDGASGTDVIACADLTIPRPLAAGSPAPTFPAGSLRLSRS